MEADWSQQIQRQYVGGNVRFDFPVRSLGWAKILGVLLIGFSILFDWTPAHEVWRAVHRSGQTGGRAGDSLELLFEIPFLIVGLMPMLFGLLILFGRSRVEWKDGQLLAAELLGPFWWTRRMPRKALRKLGVSASTTRNADGPVQEYPKLSALVAEYEDGSKKLLVLGYPKDWLLGVAQELKNYAGGGDGLSAGPIEVVETTPLNPNDVDTVQQPAGSRVQVEERVNGIRLTVPPAGLGEGSKGLFFFALLWCGFMTVFTTVAIVAGFDSKDKGDGAVWVFVGFITVFWGIGAGLMAAALNMGKRTATFMVEGGELRIETKGLFGVKQWVWRRDEVAAIRVDNSNVEVNDRPVLNLQIFPRTGKKTGLLAGRNEDELRWMATRLRGALKVPAR